MSGAMTPTAPKKKKKVVLEMNGKICIEVLLCTYSGMNGYICHYKIIIIEY